MGIKVFLNRFILLMSLISHCINNKDFCCFFPFSFQLDITDLDLVNRLSNGKVDLTFGRYVHYHHRRHHHHHQHHYHHHHHHHYLLFLAGCKILRLDLMSSRI